MHLWKYDIESQGLTESGWRHNLFVQSIRLVVMSVSQRPDDEQKGPPSFKEGLFLVTTGTVTGLAAQR